MPKPTKNQMITYSNPDKPSRYKVTEETKKRARVRLAIEAIHDERKLNKELGECYV